MIHPSYVDLMKVVNKDVEEGETPVINSRYSIVMATAKRARQIVDGDEPLVKVTRGEKPLSIAVDELNQAEIRILAEDEVEEDYTELLAPAAEEDAAAGEEADFGEVSEEGAEEASAGADVQAGEEMQTGIPEDAVEQASEEAVSPAAEEAEAAGGAAEEEELLVVEEEDAADAAEEVAE
ncbi:MAG: DNA-directed RNA polymerase subunit omega [Eubacteriales bacterium]|nr:DNA-directed RNA polymerase subunit omega [Eubacteriales bacterium]